MWRFFILVVIFSSPFIIFSQKNKKVTLNFDDLMSEISQISKTNNQYIKYDSVLQILNSMEQRLTAQDSLISKLKKNVNIVQLKTDKLKEVGYYVIVGAYRIPQNAKNIVNTKFKYPLTIYHFPTSKLNYVGYKIKMSDSILNVLRDFRNNFVKDAWILKVSDQ